MQFRLRATGGARVLLSVWLRQCEQVNVEGEHPAAAAAALAASAEGRGGNMSSKKGP